MIVIKSKAQLTYDETSKCNQLIEENFGNSRLPTYEKVIYYILENKIVGFVGICDNYLNQLCTDINYRNQGIASELIESARNMLGGTIYLFINKTKDRADTDNLLKFYTKRNFNIEFENEVEYKMYNVLLYKN
jgi:ribosomal protein S18 acetylase RimI-like enzyme